MTKRKCEIQESESSGGWIRLHRKMLDWEWYDDSNTMRLFLHLLLLANHAAAAWHGVTVPRGQVLTGRMKLASALGLSERQIRTSISRLKSTGEIAIKSTSKYSLITICKYDEYQVIKNKLSTPNDQQADQQTTNKRPTNDQQPTTNNKKNNNKEEEEIKSVDFDLSFIDLLLKRQVTRWMEYRASRKKPITSQFQLEAFVADLARLSEGMPDMAEAIINKSISNQWIDIFALTKASGKSFEPTDKMYTYAEMVDLTTKAGVSSTSMFDMVSEGGKKYWRKKQAQSI